MALTPGTKLGPYEIQCPLGAGGVGEVYRARDTRLDRTVAIKILSPHLSSNPEAKQRFEREARAISSLNHPHICTLYDVGHQDETDYLVMEFLEGETLADRLRKGPLPPQQVLKYGVEIGEGLERAHRTGVVHRDLKPGNIMLTKAGAKLMDFGLAKAASAVAPPPSGLSMTQSTPAEAYALSTQGTIIGTFQYMSPEQIEGKEADARSDIFAFGAVLYEMVTGRRAFEGESQLSVASAILEKDPAPMSSINPLTPSALDRAVKKCLAKLPDGRWQSASDLASELHWIGEAGSLAAAPPATSQRKVRERLGWAMSAVFLLATIALAISLVGRTPNPLSIIVSEISPPTNAKFSFVGFTAGPPALSPDGRRLAFSAVGSDGFVHLWIRPLDSTAAEALDGTVGATLPFWSPDSRYLGFFANGKLNRIEASGGAPMPLCDVSYARGGSWGSDGTILFAPSNTGAIFRVLASGGTPQPVTTVNAALKQTNHRWPQFLPDGKHFLFSAGSFGESATYAASLSGGESRLIVRNNSNAVYVPPSHLLFLRQGTLMAQEFDGKKLRSLGDPRPLIERVAGNPILGKGTFSVSENGVLVYQSGSTLTSGDELLWLDRTGKQTAKTGTPGEYGTAAISPDGRKLAAATLEPSAIWVYDVVRGIRTRLTFEPAVIGQPEWTPDGKSIVFFSDREGPPHVYQKAADGTGTTTPLVVDDATEFYPSVSADGRYLLFEHQATQPNSPMEVWILPLLGERKAVPVVQSQFDVVWPALSPNGKWLAYVSAESGREELYVMPFLHGSGKWLISTNGGTRPRWRRDSQELFYLSLDYKVMSVRIEETGLGLSVGEIQPLFQARPASSPGWLYDVSADGKKFLMVSEGSETSMEPLTLVVNWAELLKKRQ